MSIEKAKLPATVPASHLEELASEARDIAKRIGAPSGDIIRVNKDKTFMFPNGESAKTVTGIVVGFVTINQYYEGDYDSKNIRPPVCVAIGRELAEMKPYDESPAKQNDACHSCWANQWGSYKRGKACKNQRLIAIVGADQENQREGPIMLVKGSPTATRHWDSYAARTIALAEGLVKVVTEIFFAEAEEFASLRFRAIGPNEHWDTAFLRRDEAMTRLLMKPEFSPIEVATKPAAKAAAGAKK
jgi:hypothetical protein